MGFRTMFRGLFGLGHPRQQALGATKFAAKPGLHPTDAHGQYVSPKATSKRNRRKVA